MSASARVRRTDVQRGRVVERAVRFIRQRVALHRKQFALDVGKHLFENVYMSDLKYYRRTGAKDDSIERIASDPGVEVSENTLRMCIHVYLLTLRHGVKAPDVPIPELSVWAWNGLWDLEADPESLVAVAAWAQGSKIPLNLLRAVARLVAPYVESGGRLDDLLVGDPGERRADTPYRRIKRMAGVVERWLRTGPSPSPRAREKALEVITRIEEALHRP